jgi:hypothetical protein
MRWGRAFAGAAGAQLLLFFNSGEKTVTESQLQQTEEERQQWVQ